MNLVFGEDRAVADWVCGHIPHVGDADDLGPMVAVGVANGTGMVAGIVYHNWTPRYGHCEITFAAASPRFATRGIIRALLSVPFLQWECRGVTLIVPHDAARTVKFITGIGFVREGCKREFFAPKRHALIYGMKRSEFARLFARRA